MWKADNKPLDFTPHKDDVWNLVKEQYCELLIPMMKNIEKPVLYLGGKKMGVYLNSIFGGFRYMDDCDSYGTVCIFDTIESLFDPFYFMTSIKFYYCNPNTRIFITHPHRAVMNFWSYNHWQEYDPERFMYLIDKCGFDIVQHKYKIIKRKFKIGLRPFLRFLFGRYYLHAYELRVKNVKKDNMVNKFLLAKLYNN